MAQLQLEVVTPERRVLSEAVESVVVPGAGGELGILPGHTPLISQLQTGVLSYTAGGKTAQLHVSGGFLEVKDDHVSVLAEIAAGSDSPEPPFCCVPLLEIASMRHPGLETRMFIS